MSRCKDVLDKGKEARGWFIEKIGALNHDGFMAKPCTSDSLKEMAP
jgi:hypothetical protein